jgi:hypothetical protein
MTAVVFGGGSANGGGRSSGGSNRSSTHARLLEAAVIVYVSIEVGADAIIRRNSSRSITRSIGGESVILVAVIVIVSGVISGGSRR